MQINTIELVGGTKARAKDVNDNINILKSAIYELEESLNEYKQVVEEVKRKPVREMFDIYFSITSATPAGAFPLWTGEWIAHCETLYPDFWKELLNRIDAGTLSSVDNTAYENSLSTYGQCGSFVVDELNGRVRLPKITRFISSISSLSDIGVVQNDELKSHTHKVSRQFSDSGSGWPGSGHGPNNDDTFETWATGGDETRPKNVRLALYIQVVNNTAAISEMDINLIAEKLIEASDALTAQTTQALSEIETAKQYALDNIVSGTDLKSEQMTLLASNWDSTNKQTLSIDGLTTESIIWVTPSVSEDNQNEEAYTIAGVRAITQANGSLTFMCQTLPTEDITVTIVF